MLLIVAALDDDALADLLYEEARLLDLDCLVEVHDEPELERALELGADVIGINNRNLDDLTRRPRDDRRADHRRARRARPWSPSPATTHAEQLAELERIGCDAVLIGEALMRSGDPEARDPRADHGRGARPASTTWTAPPRPDAADSLAALSVSR